MKNSEIIDRLREATEGDHDRGCEGRSYTCSCGYDERLLSATIRAADHIAALETEIAQLRDGSITFAAANANLGARCTELEAALEKIKDECDPSDPEWSDAAAGRRYCFDVAARLSSGRTE